MSDLVLVTGATSGIGLATAKALAARGDRVVAVGRTPASAARAAQEIAAAGSGAVEWLAGDLADPRQVNAVADAFLDRHDRLDVLVNNAGTTFRRRLLTPEGVEMTLAVNHLAPFLLTHRLLGALQRAAPSRVVNVSSITHERGSFDFDDMRMEAGYRQLRAYSRSKLANVLFTHELARRLHGTGVTVNAVHPGLVRTRLGSRNGWRRRIAWDLIHLLYRRESVAAEEGAVPVVAAATRPELAGVLGVYFAAAAPGTPSPESRDPEVAARLWEYSERMVGLR